MRCSEPVGTDAQWFNGASGWFCSLLVVLSTLLSHPGFAQSRIPDPGRPPGNAIVGLIIDADAGQPLPFAQVLVDSIADDLDEGAIPASESSRSFRVMLTDETGRYAFEGLKPGYYRLHVRSAGYAPASVDVDLTRGGEARLTIGLKLSPIELPTIEITGDVVEAYLRTRSADAEISGARRNVVLDRQDEFLESDVRVITAGEVNEAITLAESDIFRALQRLPGVGRRDDYTAVLWTRGAPWVMTRVYFDGLPLYNPTHGGWLFSSLNTDGIGLARFQPGVRSASWGEGAAGILDIRSRRGTAGKLFSAAGEMSLASARVNADGELPGGIRWMVAMRRTYIDILTRAWEYIGHLDDRYVPYDFSDGIGRLDVPLPFGASFTASGIVENDRLRGDIRGMLVGNAADWGNNAGHLTLRAPIGPLRLEVATGGTRFSTDVSRQIRAQGESDETTLSPLENLISHRRTTFQIESVPIGAHQIAFSVGTTSIRDSLTYDGPFVLTGEGIPGIDLEPTHYRLNTSNTYRGYWAEMRFSPDEFVDVQGGIRVEQGDTVTNLGPIRFSPSFTLRYRPVRSVSFSTGWARSHQYTQAIGAAAGPLGPQLHIGNLWVLADRFRPAIISDIATAGSEVWLDDSWLIAATTYIRFATGITDPDPVPGPLQPRREFVVAENTAYGFELNARKLTGQLTGQFGFALGRSMMEAEGLRFPSSADIRHTIDLTAMYRLGSRLNIGGAFSFASGVPFTRILIGDEPELLDPARERTGNYASVDLMLDYDRELGNFRVGGYLQILNLLGRSNDVTYAGSRTVCIEESSVACEDFVIEDMFDAGLPRLPLLGVRISF